MHGSSFEGNATHQLERRSDAYEALTERVPASLQRRPARALSARFLPYSARPLSTQVDSADLTAFDPKTRSEC